MHLRRSAWTWTLVVTAGVLLCSFAAAQEQAGFSAWTTTGPYGGYVDALAVDPQNPETFYAGMVYGIFKSVDGGKSWAESGSGLPHGNHLEVTALAIDPQTPNTLYAGVRVYTDTVTPGIYKSLDGGASWSKLAIDLSKACVVTFVELDPVSSAILYAGTNTDLYKSVDAGATWSIIGSGLPCGCVTFPAIDARTPLTMYVGAWDAGAFRSLDGGLTWEAINTGFPEQAVVGTILIVGAGDTLLASTFQGVFKSADAGATWHAASVGLPEDAFVDVLVQDPLAPGSVYASVEGKLYQTQDGGEHWVGGDSLPFGCFSTLHVLLVLPLAGSPLVAGTSHGIFKTTDAGATWEALNAKLAAADIQQVVPIGGSSSAYFAVSSTILGGLFESEDAGASWNLANVGMECESVSTLAVDVRNPGTLYAGTHYDGVFESLDGGASWWQFLDWYMDFEIVSVDPNDSATLYIAGWPAGFSVTKDGGATWAEGTGLPEGWDYFAFAVRPTSPGQLYLGTYGGVYGSHDGGLTWKHIGLGRRTANSLAIDPKSPDTIYAGTDKGIFKSVDAGKTWKRSGLKKYYVLALAIDPSHPKRLYAGTDQGVFVSTDAGSSWSPLDMGWPASEGAESVVLDPRNASAVFAGALSGVYSLTQREVMACVQ